MNPDSKKYGDVIMLYNGIHIGELKTIEAKVEPKEMCVEYGLDKTYDQFVYGEEPVCVYCRERWKQKYSSNLLTKDKDNDIIGLSNEKENDIMKTYTLPEVIENLEIGQVAMKVAGLTGKAPYAKAKYVEDGVYFDEYDGNVLKSLNGHKIIIGKRDKSTRALFIILDRKDYEDLKNKTK